MRGTSHSQEQQTDVRYARCFVRGDFEVFLFTSNAPPALFLLFAALYRSAFGASLLTKTHNLANASFCFCVGCGARRLVETESARCLGMLSFNAETVRIDATSLSVAVNHPERAAWVPRGLLGSFAVGVFQ
jgi:hypothetical protein